MTLRDEVTPEINPGDDFYNYVNKKWRDANPIPADKSRYAAFTELDERVTEQLHALLTSDPTDNEAYESKLAQQYYTAGMDEAAIEKRGLDPVRPIIAEVEAIQSADDIKALVTKRHAEGRGLLWHLGLDVDEKDSEHYVMLLSQGGLLLPNRDYYFEKSEQFDKTRAAYKEFLAKVFELLGYDNTATRVEHVYAIEEKLAEASNTSIEDRDVEAIYNPFTFQELAEQFAGFDWASYRDDSNIAHMKGLVVNQPKFITGAIKLIDSEPVEAWRDYLIAHSVIPNLRLLSKEYENLHFGFFGTVLTGAQEQEARYKRIIRNLTGQLPQPAGRLYVEAHFDESAKAAITDLVTHIKAALGERIKRLDWMSDATKEKALEKLATFMPLLGYPDTWRSYEGLTLGGDYFENVFAVRAFEWQYDIARSAGPVDRKEWLMSPATVNAYYWPNTNGITFPAAILQPPFFDASGDFAQNYGAIGEVIGHELSHGFDDQGAMYDKVGNMNSWWTDADNKAFKKRTKALVEQFDSYEIDGQHVKGELTLGENIADLAGILIAYEALQRKLEELGERTELDGFTPEQRFFIAQARGWRLNIRPELALQFLVRDPHSPADLRVNGVITNVDAWYDTWGVKESDALYTPADKRVRIW
jgi:predicted metalloendopeptidase